MPVPSQALKDRIDAISDLWESETDGVGQLFTDMFAMRTIRDYNIDLTSPATTLGEIKASMVARINALAVAIDAA